MSTTTSNLGLTKLQLNDAADITAFNSNWNKLDSVTNMFARAVRTSGTGDAYIADVPGITKLETGISFTMLPHTDSTTTSPTIDVNGLGAKYIRRRLSSNTTVTSPINGDRDDWISSGEPIELIYDGVQWKVNVVKQDANCLHGTLDIKKGGTNATTVETARKNLEVAPAKEHVSYTKCYYRTFIVDGEEIKEWINPPMIVGEEYRTTERWDFKPIYTQLLPIGSWANGGAIDYNISPHVIRYSGRIGNWTLPFINNSTDNEHSVWATFHNNSGKLRLGMCGAGANGSGGHIQIWYYKI